MRLHGHAANMFVMVCGASLASVDQQLVDGVDRNIGEPTSRAKAVAFNQRMEDLGALGERQPVHTSQYNDLCAYGQASNHFGGRLFHRDRAATLAISLRFVGARRSARAFPPRNPPSRPRATACGFFSVSWIGSSSASPTDISTMRLASWFTSRGRVGRVLLMTGNMAARSADCKTAQACRARPLFMINAGSPLARLA